MQESEVVMGKIRNNILVVNDSEEVGHDEMQVRGKSTLTNSWTANMTKQANLHKKS